MCSVCEDELVSGLLEKYLHPTQSDPIIRHRLQRYIRAGGVAASAVYLKTHSTAGAGLAGTTVTCLCVSVIVNASSK